MIILLIYIRCLGDIGGSTILFNHLALFDSLQLQHIPDTLNSWRKFLSKTTGSLVLVFLFQTSQNS